MSFKYNIDILTIKTDLKWDSYNFIVVNVVAVFKIPDIMFWYRSFKKIQYHAQEHFFFQADYSFPGRDLMHVTVNQILFATLFRDNTRDEALANIS